MIEKKDIDIKQLSKSFLDLACGCLWEGLGLSDDDKELIRQVGEVYPELKEEFHTLYKDLDMKRRKRIQ